MKKVIIAAVVIVAAIAIIVMAKQGGNKSTHQYQASLQFSWIPSGSFVGDVVGLQKFAAKHDLDLTAEWGGAGINPIQLVSSGQKTFGWAGADEVLAANEKGADLVIVGVIHSNSPVGFVSLADKNIKAPQDFVGKKVGILPFGNTPLLYEIMMRKNNVNRSKITEITIDNDLKPFINGSYDVRPAFVYDETVTLDQQGVKYNVVEPKDFGVTSIKGSVYFAKRETVEKNPEMVKAFVDTMADGWNWTIKNPDEAVAMLKEFAPEADVDRETKVLKRGIPYYLVYKNQPLNSDIQSWNETVSELKQTKTITKDVDLNKVLQLQYINEYYK